MRHSGRIHNFSLAAPAVCWLLVVAATLPPAQAAWAQALSGFLRATSEAKAATERVRQHQPVAALPFIGTTIPPTLGLANITPPTLVPPAVHLDLWRDAHPVDISWRDMAIGELLATSFAEKPTVTPPPLQNSLDLVKAGCPLLTGWPLELEVQTVDPCDSSSEGLWLDAAKKEPIIGFKQSCSLFSSGMTPHLVYSAAQGELMAVSHLVTTLVGTRVAISDCSGAVRFFLEEKVYHEVGKTDPISCEEYGSCDGTVWIQYFLYEADGRLVAQTSYLKLFEDSFEIHNPAGEHLASASRIGDWEPPSEKCEGPRRWLLQFASPAPAGPLSNPTDQWPLAALVTIAAVRDASRRPSGLLAMSGCEIKKMAGATLAFFFVVAVLLVGSAVFFAEALEPCRRFLWELEQRLCPRRMQLPSKYDGG